MTLKQSLPFLLMLTFSCGPDTETNNGTTNNGMTNNGGTNNGTASQEIVVRTTMAIDEPDTTITATAMNQDGSEVAIATKNFRTFEEKVRIYSTTDGSELREMSDFSLPDNPDEGNIVSVENLFWSESNKLTALQSFRHRFIWDSASGDLIEKTASSEVTDKCAGPRGGVFHPGFNVAFVETVAVPADNTLCRIDFDSNTSEVFTLTEGPVIAGFILDTSGDKLWVSFSDPTDENAFSNEIINTVAYNPTTLMPLTDSLTTDANLVVVGEGFFVSDIGLKVSVAPGGELVSLGDRIASPTGNVLLSKINDRETRFVALPSGALIGIIPKDEAFLRSFSGNGNLAVTVAAGTSDLTISQIDTRTSTSTFVEPVVPAGTLTGTVTIDGVEEAISGNCEIITDSDLGVTQFTALGTSASGWEIYAHSQNLLDNNYYQFEKDGERYINNTAIAQNLMIDGPTSTSTGTGMDGQGTLFEFEKYAFFERVIDGTHSSGFKAIDFVFNGICTP